MEGIEPPVVGMAPVFAAADVPAGTLTQRAMQGAWELSTGWIRSGTARP